jgi:general secretion pathway protein F
VTPYSYQASTAEGRLISGRIEARTPQAARSELRRRGLYPVAVQEAGGDERSSRRARPSTAFSGSRRAVALEFTRELAILLQAGFSLDRSLALLGELLEDPADAPMIAAIREDVRRGTPFSEALGRHPRVFNRTYVGVVAAGEEAGRLDRVVASLAAYLERRAEVRERIRSALVYPVLMTIVGGCAVLILLVFVLPKFVAILEEAERGLPFTTALLVGAGHALDRFWWLVLALAALAGWGLARYRTTAVGTRRLAAADLGAPLWGALRREAMTADFCQTLALLLRNGVPLVVALRTASPTVSNALVRERLEAAESRVRKGEPLSGSLEAAKVPFPRLAIQMIGVGEQSGELSPMLEQAAEIFRRRVDRRTDRFITLLEPALIVLFGAIVGLVALAMFQAVYGIQEVPL